MSCIDYDFNLYELFFPYIHELFFKVCKPRDKTLIFMVIIIRCFIYYYIYTLLRAKLEIEIFEKFNFEKLFYVLMAMNILSIMLVLIKRPEFDSNVDQNKLNEIKEEDNNKILTRNVGPSNANKTLMPEVITPEGLQKSMS